MRVAENMMDAACKGTDRACCGVGCVVTNNSAASSVFLVGDAHCCFGGSE